MQGWRGASGREDCAVKVAGEGCKQEDYELRQSRWHGECECDFTKSDETMGSARAASLCGLV